MHWNTGSASWALFAMICSNPQSAEGPKASRKAIVAALSAQEAEERRRGVDNERTIPPLRPSAR